MAGDSAQNSPSHRARISQEVEVPDSEQDEPYMPDGSDQDDDDEGGFDDAENDKKLFRAETDFNLSKPADVADSRELGVNLAQLQEYLAITVSLRRSCGTLPLTITLWITYLLMVFYHGGASVSFESANHIETGLAACRITSNGVDVTYKEIQDWRQIMPWIKGGLVPSLKDEDQRQVLVGFVRVKQKRGQVNATCDLSEDLRTIYGVGCFPEDGKGISTFGPERKWYELKDPAFTSTSAAGGTFEFWIEANRSTSVINTRLDTLIDEGWIDLATQEVNIEGLYLNVEEHVYSHFGIDFKIHREGFIESALKVYPLRGDIFTHWAQVFLDIIWMLVFVALFYSVFTETLLEKSKGLLSLHLQDPFFWLDVSLLLMGLSIIITFYIFVYWLDKFTEEVFRLGVMPTISWTVAPDDQQVQALIDAAAYQDQLTKVIDWVDWFVNHNGWIRFCSCVYACLMVFRFFRGFTGQPRIAVLVQTFLFSAGFVLHFLVLLFLIFCVFALGGYILFGEQLEGWTTPIGAISKMLLVFFLRFDYQEFHEIAPISSAIWFSSFFVLVVILMQRLVAAAIVDTYVSVRSSLGEQGQGLIAQMSKFLGDILFQRSYRGAQKSVPEEDLLHLISMDSDPAYMKKLGLRQVDRRLKTRADLARAESSPSIDVDFLVQRGCDRRSAERLLQQCAEWTYSISTTSSPVRRLLIMVVRQMHLLRFESEKLQDRIVTKFDRSVKVVDRIDLKQAKCLSLAKRIRKGQSLPPGWTAHMDSEGRRYLRQEETGLTSWTLPKHML